MKFLLLFFENFENKFENSCGMIYMVSSTIFLFIFNLLNKILIFGAIEVCFYVSLFITFVNLYCLIYFKHKIVLI